MLDAALAIGSFVLIVAEFERTLGRTMREEIERLDRRARDSRERAAS